MQINVSIIMKITDDYVYEQSCDHVKDRLKEKSLWRSLEPAFSESDAFLFSALPFPNPHIIMELDTHTKNSKY